MSVQEITQKIITDAEETALNIIRGAESEVKRIAEETENLKKKAAEENEKETKKLLEEEKKKSLSRSNQSSRQRINSVKREILDAAYDKAMENIASLDDDEYGKLFEKTLSGLEKNKEIESFLVPEKRKEISEKILAKKGFQNAIIASKEFSGGIKVIGESFEYDLTFENLLKNLKESNETDIASKIFSQ